MAIAFGSSGALAQTATTTFDVRIVIDAESVITVECADGTPYEVALDGGLDGDRDMDGSDRWFVEYELYQDAARSREWGASRG